MIYEIGANQIAPGRLAKVEKRFAERNEPVDRSWEIATLARWKFQAMPEEWRFGVCHHLRPGYARA